MVGRPDPIRTGRVCIVMCLGWRAEGGRGRILGRWVCTVVLVTGVVVCMMDLGLTGEDDKMSRMLRRLACTTAPVKEAAACMLDLGLTGEGGKMNRILSRWLCTMAPVKKAVACMRDRYPVVWACTRTHLCSRAEGGRMSRIPGLCWGCMSPGLLVVVACMMDRLLSEEGHRMMALGERWVLGHMRSWLSAVAVGWP